jgi:hypothetical protein
MGLELVPQTRAFTPLNISPVLWCVARLCWCLCESVCCSGVLVRCWAVLGCSCVALRFVWWCFIFVLCRLGCDGVCCWALLVCVARGCSWGVLLGCAVVCCWGQYWCL